MLCPSETRVPKILSHVALMKPNKMNSAFYLNKAKEFYKNNNLPESFRHFVNYFESLDHPSNSSPSEQLGFTRIVCQFGKILEETNSNEELLEIYLQAVNIFPENHVILTNLGAHMFRIGWADVARVYLEKAAARCKTYLPAEKNLMHCKWHQVPRWHFKMLNDTTRNYAYYKAITNIISKGYKNVIDIGAGCGLLSLIASQDPEANVIAIEENKVLAAMSEQIMKENGRNNIKVLNCHSTKFQEPPGLCNFLVTEIFDVAIFGERMLESLVHAHAVLVTDKENFKIVPCGAKLCAAGINYRSPQTFRVTSGIKELNLENMCIRQMDANSYEAEDLTLKDFNFMSEPVAVFDLSFYDVVSLNELLTNTDFSRIIDVNCVQDGCLTSLAVWFDLHLDEETTITTNPSCENRVKCWEQAIFHLTHPVDVQAGEIVQFQMTLVDSELKFYQVTKPETCVECWLVSEDIITFLNDAPLVREIVSLANKFKSPQFLKKYSDTQRPVMDLMCFPLWGFLLAAKQECHFITSMRSNTEFDFFRHILNVNNIPQAKMVLTTNTIEYLKQCRACLLEPINSDGSLQVTINLKEEIKHHKFDILIMPVKVVVKVVLVYSAKLEEWNVVNDANVFDFKIADFMNDYTGTEHPELEDFSYKEYSTPISFVLDDKVYLSIKQNILVAETGHINGLYTWYEMQYYGNTDFSTKESFRYKRSCYLLRHTPVELGDLFQVVMRREGTYLDFRLEK